MSCLSALKKKEEKNYQTKAFQSNSTYLLIAGLNLTLSNWLQLPKLKGKDPFKFN